MTLPVLEMPDFGPIPFLSLHIQDFLSAKNTPHTLEYSSTLSNFIIQNFDDLFVISPKLLPLHNSELLRFRSLKPAFIHSSFVHEHANLGIDSNERLEFLGDGILNFCVAKKIFELYPQMNEGDMSKLKSALVNEETLQELSLFFQLHHFLILGNSERKKALAHSEKKTQIPASLIADVFEAFLAQYFLNTDLKSTQDLFYSLIELYELHSGRQFYDQGKIHRNDYKSMLQEFYAKKGITEISYKLEDSSEKEAPLKVSLIIEGKVVGELTGTQRKKIEKELAFNQYQKIQLTL